MINKECSPSRGILETMTIADVRNFRPEVVVLPVGSTEPHGPHLPYGTDTFITDGITQEAVRVANADKDVRVLCLPTLPISNNVNFKGFPFTCRIRVETLMAIFMDIVTALAEDGVRKVVIANWHGGNESTVKASLRQLYDRFQQEIFICDCSSLDYSDGLYSKLFKDGSPHAGDMETSLIWHIAPGLVVQSACKESPPTKTEVPALDGVHWIRSWHHFLPESCGGRPDMASAEKGKQFFDASVKGLAKFLAELSRAPWHPDFPYPRR